MCVGRARPFKLKFDPPYLRQKGRLDRGLAFNGILVDEGRLSWDDRAVDRLPGFALSDSLNGCAENSAKTSDTNAIALPSGDHAGCRSAYLSLVRRRRPVPSRLTM